MIPGIVSAPLFAAAQALTGSASPPEVSKVDSSYGGTKTLTTPTTTVTVTGGTGPYTHSWATNDVRLSATDPSLATTAFTATLDAGEEVDADGFDTVTDANGIVTVVVCGCFMSLVDFR